MKAAFLESVTRSDGLIDPSALANTFGISKRRLAEAVGLQVDALYRKSRIDSTITQERLSDLVGFMDRIVSWYESPAAAFNWYCWHPIIPFRDRTAEEVFKTEGVDALMAWVGRIEAGVYI